MWTPPAPGDATIRATVTFDVTLYVTGPPGVYREPRATIQRQSGPLLLRVDELRAVNVIPRG